MSPSPRQDYFHLKGAVDIAVDAHVAHDIFAAEHIVCHVAVHPVGKRTARKENKLFLIGVDYQPVDVVGIIRALTA